MTSALHQTLRRTIQRYGLCPPGSRVLIGLSGGSDSVSLVFLLRDLAENGRFTIAGLAHLNHRLRPSADRDEVFCRCLAERLNLRILVETIDVQQYAQDCRLSTEDAARRIRYDFLERAADTLEADRIAVGHTQDDQAETLLLKLMRGAGLTGLAGIHPKKGRLIRPLLDASRGDLRQYLSTLGESWNEDETNADLDNPRNRVRHVVLPQLDVVARGRTRPAIARAAALIREDGEWLDQVSAARYSDLVAESAEGVEVDSRAAVAEPPAIRRRVLLRAMRAAGGNREIGLDHVETLMAVLDGTRGGVDVPGLRAELRRGKLVLAPQKAVAK